MFVYDRVGVCGRVSLSIVRAEKRTERERHRQRAGDGRTYDKFAAHMSYT